MSGPIKPLRLLLVSVGLLTVFAAERYAEADNHDRTLAAGWIIFILGCLTGLVSWARAKGTDRTAPKLPGLLLFGWQILMALGILLYHLHGYLSADRFTTLRPILLGLYLSAIILGFFWGLGVEWSMHRSGRDWFAERIRVQSGARSLLSLGLLLLGLLGTNFFLAKRDKVFDLSYFKTTRPGESTRKIVEQLESDVRVGAFFSKDSEVAPYVRDYMNELSQPRLKVEFYDKDRDPKAAEEFRVSRDGQIVFLVGEKRQRIDIGDRLEDARRKLRTLDSTFQKTLLLSTSKTETVYFSLSHGEMGWQAESGSNELRSIRSLETLLRNQNLWPRRIDTLFTDIPNDGLALAIIGPSAAFAPQEVESIRRFIDRGGRLLLALDVDKGNEKSGDILAGDQNEMKKILDDLGVTFHREIIVNDRDFVATSRQKIDRYFLYTNVFGSHDAVKTLTRNEEKLSLLNFRSGSLDFGDKAVNGWELTGTAESMRNSFLDLNENLEFDEGKEKRGGRILSIAAEKALPGGKRGKVLIFADASQFSDPLMQSPGNQWAALDGFRWLLDREETSGAVASEEDVFIKHSHMRDLWVFHGSIYLIPLAVLAFGFLMNRKKRKTA